MGFDGYDPDSLEADSLLPYRQIPSCSLLGDPFHLSRYNAAGFFPSVWILYFLCNPDIRYNSVLNPAPFQFVPSGCRLPGNCTIFSLRPAYRHFLKNSSSLFLLSLIPTPIWPGDSRFSHTSAHHQKCVTLSPPLTGLFPLHPVRFKAITVRSLTAFQVQFLIVSVKTAMKASASSRRIL